MNYADWFLLGLAAVTAAMLLFPYSLFLRSRKTFLPVLFFNVTVLTTLIGRNKEQLLSLCDGLLRVLYADKRACGGDRRGHINFYSGICHLLSFPRLFLPIVFKKSYRFNSNLGAECRKSVLSSRSFHMVDSDESFSSFINCPRRGRFVLLSLILDLFHVSQSKSGKKKRKQPKERHT